MLNLSSAEHRELLAALADIKSIHQTIGKLGTAMRRCKAGSERHKDYDTRLVRLQRQSDEASDKITQALLLATINPKDE